MGSINSSPHFYAYKVFDFEFLGEFGIQGKGPSDLHDPHFSGQIIKTESGFKMWVFEMNLMKFSLIDIDQALKTSENPRIESFVLPPEVNTAVNIIALDEKVLVGTGIDAMGEFFIYDVETRKFQWKDFLNRDSEHVQRIEENKLLGTYSLGTIKIKPDASRFVKAFNFQPIIDVYNSNAALEYSIELKGENQPKMNFKTKWFDSAQRLYYSNVFLTDNYIYAMNQNCTFEEFNSNACSQVEVDVFNWEGVALKKFQLNEPAASLGPFVVDEVNERLIKITPKEEYDAITVFDISDH